MKGGYKVINLHDVNLSTSTPTSVSGIYDMIEGATKAILFEDVTIGNIDVKSTFVIPHTVGSDFEFEIGGYRVNVNDDDEITILGSSTQIITFDMSGTALSTTDATTVDGLFDTLDEAEVPVIIKGVTIDTTSIRSEVINYVDSSGDYVFAMGGYTITVTDEDSVTVAEIVSE